MMGFRWEETGQQDPYEGLDDWDERYPQDSRATVRALVTLLAVMILLGLVALFLVCSGGRAR